MKNSVTLKDHVEYLEKRDDVKYEGYLRYPQREYFGGLRKISTVSPQRQRDHSKTDLLSAQGVWLWHKHMQWELRQISLTIRDCGFWKDIISAASSPAVSTIDPQVPPRNITWSPKTPYEVFYYTHTATLTGVDAVRKSQLAHWWAYGCRTCAMTEDD